MDIIREIIAYQGKELSDDELNEILDLLGKLKNTKAKKEAVKVLYRAINLSANQFQSIVDHASIRKVNEILRFAQKQARHYTYRSTQQFIMENEKVNKGNAFWVVVFIVILATGAAFLAPQISELFL